MYWADLGAPPLRHFLPRFFGHGIGSSGERYQSWVAVNDLIRDDGVMLEDRVTNLDHRTWF